jgi:ubiquinone/menaquinone biosynthesis C-methylase UbiE
VIGIDQSQKMLEQASHKATIENLVYCQGLAEALPFRDRCADLVFISMVYHHFTDPSVVAKQMPSRIAPGRLSLRPQRHP